MIKQARIDLWLVDADEGDEIIEWVGSFHTIPPEPKAGARVKVGDYVGCFAYATYEFSDERHYEMIVNWAIKDVKEPHE